MLAGIKRAIKAYYEAAKPSKQRKFRRDTQSPNQLVQTSAAQVKAQARFLERNHDLSRGIIRTMVNNLVGPNGIGVEPQPRRSDGTVHEEYAQALRDAWRDWGKKPEVTHMHHWARCQRMMARAWVRDGEAFAQVLTGPVQFLDHGTKVPLSLELFESDMIPLDYEDGDRIKQGIEVNTWGRPVAYHVWKKHPLESGFSTSSSDLKRISTQNIIQIATLDRIGQLRGVSEFASIITRLEDIKDYEESERVAAKIAAKMTAYVKRGQPEMYDENNVETDENGNVLPRDLNMQAGMIIDTLAVGEEIGMIDSNRPNPNLITFRQGQLRAIAAGVGVSYSSSSRDYNGTYSAQRQELVEQWCNYAVLTDDFVGQVIQPVWEAFVQAAHLSGIVRIPRDVSPDAASDAMFIGQSMPWIDPLKEANGWATLVKAGFASEVEVIRKRGGNPRDVLDQIESYRNAAKEKGLVFDSDAANDSKAVDNKKTEEETKAVKEAAESEKKINDIKEKDAEALLKKSLAESRIAEVMAEKSAIEKASAEAAARHAETIRALAEDAESARLRTAMLEEQLAALGLDELTNG